MVLFLPCLCYITTFYEYISSAYKAEHVHIVAVGELGFSDLDVCVGFKVSILLVLKTFGMGFFLPLLFLLSSCCSVQQVDSLMLIRGFRYNKSTANKKKMSWCVFLCCAAPY